MDNLILVNKENMLDRKYFPPGLVIVDNNENNFHNYVDKNMICMVNEYVYANFFALQKDCVFKNFNIIIDSGYRSFDYQNRVLENLKNEKGEEYASKYVAIAGASEHQTGLAVDFAYYKDGVINDNVNEDDEAVKYISKVAHKYGFIVRYPKGKENITGVNYEPWHLRYVGFEHAMYMYENGLTLEEYLKLIKTDSIIKR